MSYRNAQKITGSCTQCRSAWHPLPRRPGVVIPDKRQHEVVWYSTVTAQAARRWTGMGSTPLEDQLNAAIAVTSAKMIVLDEQRRQADSEDAEIAALGIDLDAMERQYEADQRQAAEDQDLMDRLVAMAEAANTSAGQLDHLLAESEAVLARAEARQARLQRFQRALAVVANIRQQHSAPAG